MWNIQLKKSTHKPVNRELACNLLNSWFIYQQTILSNITSKLANTSQSHSDSSISVLLCIHTKVSRNVIKYDCMVIKYRNMCLNGKKQIDFPIAFWFQCPYNPQISSVRNVILLQISWDAKAQLCECVYFLRDSSKSGFFFLLKSVRGKNSSLKCSFETIFTFLKNMISTNHKNKFANFVKSLSENISKFVNLPLIKITNFIIHSWQKIAIFVNPLWFLSIGHWKQIAHFGSWL